MDGHVATTAHAHPFPPAMSAVGVTGPREDALTAYLNDIGRLPLLSREEERALFERFNRLRDAWRQAQDPLGSEAESGSAHRRLVGHHRSLTTAVEDVRRDLIRGNLRLPVTIAKGFCGRRLSMADLVQEGTLGLIRAVEKFDVERGVRFSAYASWWIQQAIRLAITTHARTVRLPAYIQQWQRKLRQADDGSEIASLADRVGISPDQARRALAADVETVSLDGPALGTGTLADLLEDRGALRPDRVAEESALREEIESAFMSLDPRTARILRLRYGFEDGMSHSLQEVGKTLALSRERIRQLEAAALDRLRHPARAARLRDFAQFAT